MKLQVGYLIAGFVTGLIILFNFLTSLPDGKLHIVYCDVGQGDAAYIRFPDGRDMLVDGGPDDRVLTCLGRHMPFWDRRIDLIVLSHPQRDHMQGLVSVAARYRVDYFLHSDVRSSDEGFRALLEAIQRQKTKSRIITAGERITIGGTMLRVIWPSAAQIARMNPAATDVDGAVLGASLGDANDGSVVFWIRYGTFDALFPGDADTHVESNYRKIGLADEVLEVLKVPHHGSKTGLSKEYIDRLKPRISIISVGKNSYGHPVESIIQQLAESGSRVLRTDKQGDIEIVSDGKNWEQL